MSIIGKGRGRGFSEIRESALRRPGQLFNNEPSKFTNLSNLINNLKLSSGLSQEITDIVNEINVAKTEYAAEEIMRDLHKQALSNRNFGIKLAIACSDSKIYSIDESKYRKLVIHLLQEDYECREDTKDKSRTHFRNAVSFMGEFFNRLRILDQPLAVLRRPLLHYLQLLLDDSEEEDIELVTTQISLNGSLIHASLPDNLEDLVTRVKKVLINKNLSSKSRGMLLLIVDIANNNYNPLSQKLQEFYTIQLSLNTFSNIVRYAQIKNSEDESNNTNLPVNSSYSVMSNNLSDHPSNPSKMQVPKSVGSHANNTNNDEKPSVPYQVDNKQPVPRAIRGAGGGGNSVPLPDSPPNAGSGGYIDNFKERNSKKSPRNKDGADENLWVPVKPSHNKAWGHDDRFEKDYS